MFESAIGSPAPQMWVADPAWTNLTPAFRADGLVVIRKAFVGYYPQNAYGLPARYAFETLAIRGKTFLGVAGIRFKDFEAVACSNGALFVGCPGPDYLVGWAQLALSVHLATFPITAGSQTGAWGR